jgi:hypothetical protein
MALRGSPYGVPSGLDWCPLFSMRFVGSVRAEGTKRHCAVIVKLGVGVQPVVESLQLRSFAARRNRMSCLRFHDWMSG